MSPTSADILNNVNSSITTEDLLKYAGTKVTFAEFSNLYEGKLRPATNVDYQTRVVLRRMLFNDLGYMQAIHGNAYEKAKVDVVLLAKSITNGKSTPLFNTHFSQVDFGALLQ